MQQQWKKTVNGIINSIILYFLAGLLGTVFSTIGTASKIGGVVSGNGSSGIWGVLSWICTAAVIVGFVWFFINLSKFIPMQRNATDSASVTTIRTGYIVSLIGAIIGIIPALGWIFAFICSVASAIILIIAFSKYSRSTALNAVAAKGASLLMISVILNIIGSVLGIIPVIGFIFTLIFGIISLIMLFMGWSKIANNAPAA